VSTPLKFDEFSDLPETGKRVKPGLPRGLLAGIAALFLALVIDTGLDVARDFLHQIDIRRAEVQKRQLALLGELELGHAVQDFKDCLLRDDVTYCDEFDRHIVAAERTLSQYGARNTQQPEETKVLGEIRPALSAYRSAVFEVREMQSKHASIQEIDNVVRGDDRPVAAGLRELMALSDSTHTPWHVPLGQITLLTVFTSLAALSLYLTFRPSLRRSQETALSVRQLSNRMMKWEEDKEAKAFVRLHDGVCQSLAAIMYLLRSTQRLAAEGQPPLSGHIPEPVIPSLQAVIQDARAVALQLRPPRMQDTGLLATLNSLWVDSRASYPNLVIKPRALTDESGIPEGLKPVILRIAQMTVDFAAENSSACRLAWLLERSGQVLQLSIDIAVDTPVAPSQSSKEPGSPATTLDPLEVIRARVELSGGSSEYVRNLAERRTLIFNWKV
jgi:signal transduction histidine kinase